MRNSPLGPTLRLRGDNSDQQSAISSQQSYRVSLGLITDGCLLIASKEDSACKRSNTGQGINA
jgi:hypothetical protein